MYRTVLALFLFLCFGTLACERVDQAIDAVDKVKAIKSDLEKKAAKVTKDVTSRADQISEGVRKHIGKLPYGEKDKKSGEGKGDDDDGHDKDGKEGDD